MIVAASNAIRCHPCLPPEVSPMSTVLQTCSRTTGCSGARATSFVRPFEGRCARPLNQVLDCKPLRCEMRGFVIRSTVTAAILTACACPVVFADVASISLRQLVGRSEVIVVGCVSQVGTDPAMHMRVASVRVDETWKGTALESIKVCLGRRGACDVSTAAVGERVVLFLERDTKNAAGGLWIAHLGRGRAPIRDVNGTATCSLSVDIGPIQAPPRGGSAPTDVRLDELRLVVRDLVRFDKEAV